MLALLFGLLAADELPPLFTQDDYPLEALRNDQEGTVEADLVITKEGRVGACTIAVSSGFKALDDGTCAIALKRALYTPAKDRNGNATEGHDRIKVRWELPKSTGIPEPAIPVKPIPR